MATTSPKAPRAPQKPETSPAPQSAQAAEAETQTERKPIAAFRYGQVSCAVFDRVEVDGRDIAAVNISLRRSYSDKEGKWHRSHTLSQWDLPLAIVALQKCWEFLLERQRDDAQSQ